MSRDSNYTYIHAHAAHHADLFEEFCHPPSSSSLSLSSSTGGGFQQTTTTGTNNTTTQPNTLNGTGTADPGMVQIPGHFLPFEEIQLPPHLMPLNPEDEDGVVPDMHAAFGIQRALGPGVGSGPPGATGEASGRGAQREPLWRDLGMERLLETGGAGGGASVGGSIETRGAAAALAGVAGRREGQRTGILLLR